MLKKERNIFSDAGWTLTKVTDLKQLKLFDCGNLDLNDYFRNDVLAQKEELLNETYALIEATVGSEFPVALISLCNDAVRKEKLLAWLRFDDPQKIYPAYPAVKIARFGVCTQYQRNNIGTHTVNMIKKMFVTNNRTGCRLITVDAYNEKEVIDFYSKNNFQFFSEKDKKKKQRAMFFDLKRLKI